LVLGTAENRKKTESSLYSETVARHPKLIRSRLGAYSIKTLTRCCNWCWWRCC